MVLETVDSDSATDADTAAVASPGVTADSGSYVAAGTLDLGAIATPSEKDVNGNALPTVSLPLLPN